MMGAEEDDQPSVAMMTGLDATTVTGKFEEAPSPISGSVTDVEMEGSAASTPGPVESSLTAERTLQDDVPQISLEMELRKVGRMEHWPSR